MTPLPATDDLGIRLLMARNGISREDATVMWYAKELLQALKQIKRRTLRAGPWGWIYDIAADAVALAEATRPEEG